MQFTNPHPKVTALATEHEPASQKQQPEHGVMPSGATCTPPQPAVRQSSVEKQVRISSTANVKDTEPARFFAQPNASQGQERAAKRINELEKRIEQMDALLKKRQQFKQAERQDRPLKPKVAAAGARRKPGESGRTSSPSVPRYTGGVGNASAASLDRVCSREKSGSLSMKVGP